jgi:hypothetical protein
MDDQPLLALKDPLEIGLIEPDGLEEARASRNSTSSGTRGRPRGGGLTPPTTPVAVRASPGVMR